MDYTALQARKENIYRSNRKEDIYKRLKQHRKDIIKVLDERLLIAIRKSDSNLDQQTLDDLISYANSGQSDAIKQLGNLTIDNPQMAPYIGERISPFLNDSWWWLIRILATAGFLSSPFLTMLLSKLKEDKRLASSFCLQQVAQTLALITEQPPFCTAVVSHPEALVGIAALMESPREEIHRPAFRLFSNLLTNNFEETAVVIDVLGRKLSQLLKLGLLNVDLEVRLDCCMSLTNLALNGFITEELIMIILIKSLEDKPKISRELSYYLQAVANTARMQQLGKFFEHGLVKSLKFYILGDSKLAVENGLRIIQTILLRLREDQDKTLQNFWPFVNLLRSEGIFNEVCKKLQIDPAMSTEQRLEEIMRHPMQAN